MQTQTPDVSLPQKPKQIKSRSGCATCKQKRLKCDETKPTCLQCQKRNVDCAGYQKDFKWRSFAETKARSKSNAAKKAQSVNAPLTSTHDTFMSFPVTQWSMGRSCAGDCEDHDHGTNAHGLKKVDSDESSSSSAKPADPELDLVADTNNTHEEFRNRDSSTFTGRQKASSIIFSRPSYQRVSPITKSLSTCTTEDFPAYSSRPSSSADQTTNFSTSIDEHALSYISQSPQFDLAPAGDMEQGFYWPSPLTYRAPVSRINTSESMVSDCFSADETGPLDSALSFGTAARPVRGQIHAEDLIPPEDPMFELDEQTYVTPTMSASTRTSSRHLTPTTPMPAHDPSFTEQEIMMRFESQTCGMLSVVEGPIENPWRSVVQPMARDCPALYHAILSMAAFHGAHDDPSLHTPGMAQMAESMRCLAATLHKMPLDYALATTLALSFSEGWDSHVSTGVQHLRAAAVMVKNILIRHRQDLENGQVTNEGADRVRFLCNTFVYMDVIARLTSFQESSDIDLEDLLITVNGVPEGEIEVDPLMGCAITLFPLISRVANLVRNVYRSESNSLRLVSTAMELKEQIERWQPPSASSIVKPEDPTLDVQHLIQTAEAYRYATLIYLHQAVPEIPSESSEKLAKKVLYKLASVPLSSGAILVQIFPLFAASCEMTDPEDRSWVIDRWTAMTRRLKIGNMKSCWGVVQELWSRRDVAETEKANRVLRRNQARGNSNSSSAIEIPLSLKRKVSTIDEANERNIVYQEASRQQLGDNRSTLPASWTSDSGDSVVKNNRTRRMSNTQLEYEYTVRGSLHWLGVMADWRWEVFL